MESLTLRQFHGVVPGYSDASTAYKANMETLNIDGVELTEMYLSVMQEHLTEVKGRLEWVNQQQANLRTALDGLAVQENTLNQQQGDYAVRLTQGDIAAADVMERERLNQLQAIHTEKQETEHKLAAVDRAEAILKLPAFHAQLAELAETVTEMNSTIGKMDNKKPMEWEHWVVLAELLDKTGHKFMQDESRKEKRFYESIG